MSNSFFLFCHLIIVFIFFVKDTYNTELHKIYGKKVIDDWLFKSIYRIAKLLPIRLVFSELSFNTVKSLIDDNTGEGRDYLEILRLNADSLNTRSFTFSKVRMFANKHGLTFLSQEYFNRIKTKQLLFAEISR